MKHCTYLMQDIKTREAEDGNPIIAGYFVVFDSIYRISAHATESVARGAFDESIKGDVRALYNHNSDIILGRTSSDTLKLTQDDVGLYGEVIINRNDTEAMNAYERIKRGDITGCSFGFDIAEEQADYTEDSVHYTITKVDPLYEVSPCVFPAYEATSIGVRDADGANEREAQAVRMLERRKLEAWQASMAEKLRKD